MSPRPNSKQSHKFTKRRRLRFVGTISILIISSFVLIFGISSLTKLNSLTISSVTVIGADQDISDSLRATAMDALTGSYLDIFPKASTLIYPRIHKRKCEESFSESRKCFSSTPGLADTGCICRGENTICYGL